MPEFRIILTAKDTESPLADFLFNQLSLIGWISCVRAPLEDIGQQTDVDLVIVLAEDTTLREIMGVSSALRTHHKKSITVSFWDNQLILGPTHFPFKTAGADSALLLLHQRETKEHRNVNSAGFKTARLEPHHFESKPETLFEAFTELLREIKKISRDAPQDRFKLIDHVILFKFGESAGASKTRYIYPFFEGAESKTEEKTVENYKILVSKFENSRWQIKHNYFSTPPEKATTEAAYQNIAIIGGGTAGYLTALVMKAAHPDLPVTLIESSKIPVIGVGEATTPDLLDLVFDTLKFSRAEFYREVKPTWKLGIKFFWGLPGDYYFNYPFGTPDARNAFLAEGHINNSSLTSTLMDMDASFVIAASDHNDHQHFSTLSTDLKYAVHIDNVSFIRYLKKKAKDAGIRYVDDLIVDTEKKGNSDDIHAVIGEHGAKYQYDFFVDCTGFNSLLLEKSLGSPFISYSNSLFTDMAVTGKITGVEKPKPYTSAISMNSGWCWNTPMRGEDHLGYVFSSSHCSADEALAEMRKKMPEITNPGLVKFKTGRHREICIGNVFAVGNSFGFVEPLESTGIHMIITAAKTLADNFSRLKNAPVLRTVINRDTAGHWDYLRDFLAIHYKFNKKYDTPFWKDCREHTDTSDVQWMIDLYDEIGPLSQADEYIARAISGSIKDVLFGLVGFDVMMLGQGVLPKNFNRTMFNRHIWESNVKTWKSLGKFTIPTDEDLNIIIENLAK